MGALLLVVAAATLSVLLVLAVDFVFGALSMARLIDVAPEPDDSSLPPVSIVVAARNEADTIEPALASLLRQDYADYEIVVVDDRSDDATPEALARLRAGEPRLIVERVDALPPGWLGKNHALARGAGRARGDYLLFADADVIMAPTTLRRAITRMRRENLAHLTLTPHIEAPGFWLQIAVATFGIFFAMLSRPWKARDPRSPFFVGIGAFNLVRAVDYHAAGGHAPISLRPDDDYRLGQLMKRATGRSECVGGAELVRLVWYGSLREMAVGLEKNAFCGVNYRASLLVAATLSHVVAFLWPCVAIFATGGLVQVLNLAIVAVTLFGFAWAFFLMGAPRWKIVFYPVGVVLFHYLVWRAVILTWARGGIQWRDTVYPLEELKKQS